MKSLLRMRRNEAELTQEQLAKLAGVARISVQRIETGERAGSIPVMKKLAHALHCQVNDLISDENQSV